MARRPANIQLYLITDRTQTNGRALVDVVGEAVQGGVDAVQLREKDLNSRDLAVLGRVLLSVCRAHGARLLINDRIDVALAIGADGVHLPAASFACADARRLIGDHRIIGVSTHSLAEAEAAANAGADFVVFGPVYETPAKRAFGTPVGETALAEVTRRSSVPVLALGGVGPQQVASVRRCGAAGIAVVRAICAASDPRRAAITLRAALS